MVPKHALVHALHPFPDGPTGRGRKDETMNQRTLKSNGGPTEAALCEIANTATRVMGRLGSAETAAFLADMTLLVQVLKWVDGGARRKGI
jgi:hypothetical protein